MPQIDDLKILTWLQLIDISGDSMIDQNEFELAFVEDEKDLENCAKFERQEGQNADETVSTVNNALHAKSLTPSEFFKYIDKDGSG